MILKWMIITIKLHTYHWVVTNTCPIWFKEKYKDHKPANNGMVQNFWETNLKKNWHALFNKTRLIPQTYPVNAKKLPNKANKSNA